ncbi:MAG: inward rectifier potassium channel family protein [Gemmatimonadaceae bacterium]|nr:inward rectifier potassium channel family protein [Gemmatimonadaceae bacterium]
MASPRPLPPREETGDLGFGRVVSGARGRRLLNPDGSFNVVREGLPWSQAWSLYHDALTTSWPRFLGWTSAMYLGINVFFALVFYALGPEVLSGAGVSALGGRMWQAFFFSVQTFATIGYGSIVANGIAGNLVVTIEALIGLLAQALITGLLFARFARPTMSIQFSSIALIAPYQNGRALMFRIANRRRNELTEVEAQVTFSIVESGIAGLGRRYVPLVLERRRVDFFPLAWTLVHPITPESPLWGLSDTELREKEVEVLILLQGTDETFATRVGTRRSYRGDELVWGAKFISVFDQSRADGRVAVDLMKLDLYERAPLPELNPPSDTEPS